MTVDTGRRRPKICVGVDVRQSEVRLVKYDRSRRVDGAGSISVDRAPRPGMQEGLQAMTLRLHLSGMPASAAVESSRVVVRHTVLPPMPEGEIGPALIFQLPQLIPGYTEEWVHDYILLGSRNGDGDRARECLVAALPRGVVLAYYNAFQQAGLRLMSLEIRTLALWRYLFGTSAAGRYVSATGAPPCLAVLDPDDCTADLAVFEDGRLRYTRLLAGWQAGDAEDRIMERLVSEIKQSLSWYRDHRGNTPQALCVVRDPAAERSFSTLPERLGLEAYHGKAARTHAGEPAPEFAAAAGLAFKEAVPV